MMDLTKKQIERLMRRGIPIYFIGQKIISIDWDSMTAFKDVRLKLEGRLRIYKGKIVKGKPRTFSVNLDEIKKAAA